MTSNIRPAPDQVLVDIAEYVSSYKVESPQAIDTACWCMTDTLAGALDALDFPDCTKMVGPSVPGTVVPNGARIPGTNYVLDPETAAFGFGCLIRWLDFNDTFNAAQGSHPSDNLSGILMLGDHLSRQRLADGQQPLLIREVLESLVKAYEIQGCLAIENAFAYAGFMDQNIMARVASSAVLTRMLGGSRDHIINAVSNAFIDCSLAVFRYAPNTGSRKSWSSADAISQAMRLAKMTLKGEMGYPSVLTAKDYGFYDARFKGKPLTFQRPYGDYVIQHSNFKFVAAGMHSQTAIECAFKLHPLVKERLADITRVDVRGHQSFMRVMDKSGPLYNSADRELCAQYIIAMGLIHGTVQASYYEDEFAADPRIDKLRDKMVLTEDAAYTKGFFDPDKRSNTTSIQVSFKDGSSTPRVEVEYPAGHARRRTEVRPILRAKFESALARRFSPKQQQRILAMCDDAPTFYRTPVNEFIDLLVEDLSPTRAH